MPKSLKIIKYSTLSGIFLIPLIVLIITESLFFPFITGKNFIFRILIEIVFCLWLILAIYDKRYRPKKSFIFYFLLAFIFILILSTIFSVNSSRSFWSNFERMEGLITYLHILAYFIVLTSVLNKEKFWKIFFHISIGVSFIIALYGVLQLTGAVDIRQGGVRLDATLGNASYLAIYMVFHIFLSLWYFLKQKEWYRWFYAPVIILESIILYHTATRGAILGFIGGLLFTALVIGLLSSSRKIKISAISSLVLIVILVSLFFTFKSSDFITQSPVLSRFSSISFQDDTTQSRFVIWRMSWEGFKERPILGWGLENYNLIFNKYYEPILWKQEPWFDRAHNVFFDRLTTNGIFGLLIYLTLFGSALYYLLIKRRKANFSVYSSAVLASLLLAYFFHNIFVFDNLISLILFYGILAYIHYRLVSVNEDVSVDNASTGDYKKAAFSMIAIIITIFIIYSANVPGILSAKNLLLGIMYSETGFQNPEVSSAQFDGATESFKKAVNNDSFSLSEAREHLARFSSKLFDFAYAEEKTKAEIFQFASSEMVKQVEETPNDIRYMIFLGSLYNEARQYDNAIDYLSRAIDLSPKKQAIYFEIATSYINKKEYASAEELLKTAFELDTDYNDARKVYAMGLIFSGKVDLAEKLLEERYGTYIIPDERIARAYIEAKEFEKAIQIRELVYEQSPGNLQYLINIAALYLEIDDREKAIEIIERGIEIEPRFKEQGEYFINEIRAGRNP